MIVEHTAVPAAAGNRAAAGVATVDRTASRRQNLLVHGRASWVTALGALEIWFRVI